MRSTATASTPAANVPERSAPTEPLTGPLDAQVAARRAVMLRLVAGDDLVENLYFAWMEEPYRRATLAVAVKTLQVLEREVALRSRGGALLTDGQTESLLRWLDRRFSGTWQPLCPDFKPHRMIVADLPPAERVLFAFADRATFTQADSWFGDFDLLTCAGFRVYPVGRHRVLEPGDVRALRAHAAALGVDLLGAPLPSASNRAEDPLDLSAHLQPVTLRQLMAGDWEDSAIPAVIDPPRGESWSAMLARRALYRGMTGKSPRAVGCEPPRGRRDRLVERARAAMWVQAFDGQRLGVMEGWRDLRDGTPTVYRSQFTKPEYLETVAHTALDVLRLRQVVARFATESSVALVVDESHLAGPGDNTWEPPVMEAVDALHAARVRFDLLTQAALARRGQAYDLAIVLPAATTKAGVALTVTHRLRGADWQQGNVVAPSDGDAGAGIAGHIAQLARRNRRQAMVYEVVNERGERPDGVYVRVSPTGTHVALANLIGAERTLILKSVTGGAVSSATDLLSGTRTGATVSLGAYGVKLLQIG